MPLPDPGEGPDPVNARFHAEHRRRFGYAMPDRRVEVVTARLTARASRPAPPPERAPAARPARRRDRSVWFAPTGFVDTVVHARDGLATGDVIGGPAIIEQMDTTTVVPPGWRATVDTTWNLVLTTEQS